MLRLEGKEYIVLDGEFTLRFRNAPALTLAEQRIGLAGNPLPIPFKLTVDRDLIGKNAQITVTARIERKGKLLFINDTIHRALVDGQPRHVDLTLKEVGKPPTR